MSSQLAKDLVSIWEFGEVEQTTDEKVVKERETEKYKKAVADRGLDKVGKTVLDPKQIVLADVILNIADKRSLREKLEFVGVTPTEYNGWMRQKRYQEFLSARAKVLFEGTDVHAYANLAKAVESGDLSAIKFFFEMRGIYNPKLEVQVNVNDVLSRVLEILARHVDPETMLAIADELESLPGVNVGSPRANRQETTALADIMDAEVISDSVPPVPQLSIGGVSFDLKH